MKRSERGFHLLELLAVLASLLVLATLALPPILQMADDLRLRLAAAEVSAVLRLSRALAVARCANVAVKFRPQPGGDATWAVYGDGDGDGVLNRDIDDGTDPELRAPQRLEKIGNRVRFGFPPGRPIRDPGSPGRLKARDPIRFNRSDLASFSPLGGATPGTVYLTDGRGRVAAVRVTGRTGRVKVLVYDFNEEIWK